MLKNTAIFMAGFWTMGAIGVLGSWIMARKSPETFQYATDFYRP